MTDKSVLTESEEVFKRLEGLVVYLAKMFENPDHVMLSMDDIISELHEEITKGINYYSGKYDVDNMVGIIKRMCYNRISELKYRYYITYRKHDNTAVSIEMEFGMEYEPKTDEGNPECLLDSSLRVNDTKLKLQSDEAKLIFDTIIDKKNFGSVGTENVHNHMTIEDIAMFTGLSIREAANGVREIKRAYVTVCLEE